MPDHVHMPVSIPPKIRVSSFTGGVIAKKMDISYILKCTQKLWFTWQILSKTLCSILYIKFE